MARQPRIEYAGAYYHVMARGDRREPIVEDDEDRRMFVRSMGEVCDKTGWEILAWVLMKNHYHWILRTPEPNLVAGMKWFQNAYTRRLNTRHRLWGHVFGGRYKSILIESPDDDSSSWNRTQYLGAVLDYVHLNPVRAGLIDVDRGKGLLDHAWSSLGTGYAVPASKRLAWLEVRTGLSIAGCSDSPSGRRSYVLRLEQIARSAGGRRCGVRSIDGQTLHSTLQRGWYWGSQGFRELLLGKLDPRKIAANVNYRSSGPGRAKAEERARRIIERASEATGGGDWQTKADTGSRVWKVVVAHAIKQQTTMPHAWIAQQLGMKSAANVSQQIRRLMMGQLRMGKKHARWLNYVRNA